MYKLKVKVFSVLCSDGIVRYGLYNVSTDQVLCNAPAKWKTVKAAERFAFTHGYDLV